jgi:dTDP-glucose 4,6-dehydratase
MKNYDPNKLLVTGAAGFIGSNFVHYLLRANSIVKVISLDKLTYAGNIKNLENLPDSSRHQFINGDICDAALLYRILREYSIDTIVHFAAESHVDRSIIGPKEFIQTNIVGTFTLLEEARKYWLNEKKLDKNKCRFHHISTDEVYGELEKKDLSFTEKTPYSPNSPYAASKASSDHLVRSYIRTYHLPATISSCSNNYGPRQHSEKLIPTTILNCLELKSIKLYGNGLNIRDWLYVDDHCEAILSILNKGVIGETYNIGGNCEKDNLSLVKIICRMIDQKFLRTKASERLITFIVDRPGHDFRYSINAEKIKNHIGFVPKTSLIDGLLRTLEFYSEGIN